MNRILLALLLVLAGCRRGSDAVKVTITVDPAVKANCIAVEVLPAGASDPASALSTATLVRSKDELVLAVFQEKDWPADIQVRARALVGPADCKGDAVRNGRSGLLPAKFLKDKDPESVTLELPKPTAEQDADGDGFVNLGAEGEDCDDNQPSTYPGALEACDASADRNCNTKLGCEDTAACSAPSCAYLPASLSFAVVSSQGKAGACAPVVVKRLDASGRPTAPGFATPVTVTSEFPTELRLYSNPTCSVDLDSSFAIPKEGDSATFYVKGIHVKTGKLTVSSTQYGTASATHTVTPAPAKQLAFVAITAPSLKAAECSSVVTARTQDEYLNTSPVTANTALELTSTAGGAVAFFSESTCSNRTNVVTIPTGGTEASFYVKGLGGGGVILTVTEASGSLLPVSQNVNVASAVRRGTCVIGADRAFVDCALTPAVADLAKAFFVFQATSDIKKQDGSSVRCFPLDASTLRCERRAGNPTPINVAWQVVEMASGLRVYHLNGSCEDTPAATVLTLPGGATVDMNKSFVLFSSLQGGSDADRNDYATAVLKSPSQVEILLNSVDCSSGNNYSVQVVQLEGLSVSRGTVLANDSYPFVVTVPTSASLSRSLVLATYQASQPSMGTALNAICNRTMRGEVTGDMELRFYRGFAACNPGLITTISWERITAVSNASVQSVKLTANSGFTSDVQTLATAVDPNRTVLMSSTQMHGGQSSGETTYPSEPLMGVADGRFQLKLVGSEYKQIEVVRDTNKGDSFWTVYALQFEP